MKEPSDWDGVLDAIDTIQDALNDLRCEVGILRDRVEHPRTRLRLRSGRPPTTREAYQASRLALLARQGGQLVDAVPRFVEPSQPDPDRPRS